MVANMNDLPTLLRNDGGNRLNSIIIQVFGTRSNRDGVGTGIRLKTAGGTQFRTVNGASSYLSYSDIRTHVGLGTWTGGRPHRNQLARRQRRLDCRRACEPSSRGVPGKAALPVRPRGKSPFSPPRSKPLSPDPPMYRFNPPEEGNLRAS